jgi:hypothetical protein
VKLRVRILHARSWLCLGPIKKGKGQREREREKRNISKMDCAEAYTAMRAEEGPDVALGYQVTRVCFVVGFMVIGNIKGFVF